MTCWRAVFSAVRVMRSFRVPPLHLTLSDDALDLPLRGDAHLLEELANVYVEAVLIHRGLQGNLSATRPSQPRRCALAAYLMWRASCGARSGERLRGRQEISELRRWPHHH